ncbi:N-6 DNA methylase [Streptomyces sp. NPDC012389]|uniref:N-6 DNA methylase n=1 Tax=Streptomyces sp. NPDC012389 TaxID=3364830 RepID=UPI0036E49C53
MLSSTLLKALHGIDGGLSTRRADTLADDRQPGLQADFVMSAPPFNVGDRPRDRNDVRRKYGLPPAGNANYAWLQHVLSTGGTADRRGQILFVDARQSGAMADRAERVPAEAGLRRIADAYHAWRGTASAQAVGPEVRERTRPLPYGERSRST